MEEQEEIMKCPGLDTRYWKDGDIFEVLCPECGDKVEFFKDDSQRKCPGCGNLFFNPKVKTDCLQYCKFADNCKELLNNESIS